jgi:hypothetical protein
MRYHARKQRVTAGALAFQSGRTGAAQADVAQWQSNGFVNRRLAVQVRSSAPVTETYTGS